jgi:hypothetical protein
VRLAILLALAAVCWGQSFTPLQQHAQVVATCETDCSDGRLAIHGFDEAPDAVLLRAARPLPSGWTDVPGPHQFAACPQNATGCIQLVQGSSRVRVPLVGSISSCRTADVGKLLGLLDGSASFIRLVVCVRGLPIIQGGAGK